MNLLHNFHEYISLFVIINLFLKNHDLNKDLIWPLVHYSTLNIGKNRCESCWNMNPDHEPICWKTSDSADNKYKHIYTPHPHTPSVRRCNPVGKTPFNLRSWGNSDTWRHIGVKPQREWIGEVLVYYLFPAGIQDTRWMAISWTAACPVKTLTSWAALKMATFTAGTWWKWVCLYIYVLVLPESYFMKL